MDGTRTKRFSHWHSVLSFESPGIVGILRHRLKQGVETYVVLTVGNIDTERRTMKTMVKYAISRKSSVQIESLIFCIQTKGAFASPADVNI